MACPGSFMEERPQGLCVLIADDDVDSARVLAELLPYLCLEPVTIIVAFDGGQAVRLATGAVKPHVVVMDIEMPVMDGFQAASAIKLALEDLCPLLIAVSGNLDRVEFAARGGLFDHALGKPVQVGMLAALIDRVCYEP